ncbi:MAG: GyrI-like domain-containing protein [Sulfuricurvum sp.]
MKRETKHHHADIVNAVLSYIYLNIDTDLHAEELATMQEISVHHLHRLFKEETRKNLYETIKSIRLQKASSLLLTNRYATVSEVASMCGYSSQTSFIKAFRERFSMTPKAWKKGGYLEYSRAIVGSTGTPEGDKDFEGQVPRMLKAPPIRAAYIRHRGYDASIADAWNRLRGWSIENDIPESARQIGFHHDNPTVTPLDECAYIAAIEVPYRLKEGLGKVAYFEIPASLCAVFRVQGKFGDVLRFMAYVYHTWLPQSGFEAKTLPAYAIYRKNHFLDESGEFDLDFYLPVTLS